MMHLHPHLLVGVLCCMAIPHKSAREFDERFFVRKRCKTAGILCVFQGFTNEFLAEKIRQNPQTHLCGVALTKEHPFHGFTIISPGVCSKSMEFYREKAIVH